MRRLLELLADAATLTLIYTAMGLTVGCCAYALIWWPIEGLTRL